MQHALIFSERQLVKRYKDLVDYDIEGRYSPGEGLSMTLRKIKGRHPASRNDGKIRWSRFYLGHRD